MKKTLILSAALLVLFGCETDFVNPNAATDEEVLSAEVGLISLVNGLKGRYSLDATGGLYNAVTVAGLATDELFVINAGNAFHAALEAGGTTVAGNNAILENLWRSLSLINSDADKLLENVGNVADPGVQAGIIAYASLFKGLAIGTRALFWEQVTTASLTLDEILANQHVPFVGREAGLQAAVEQLEQGLAALSTPLSPRFTQRVGTAIDIEDALHALAARFSLFAGDFDNALRHADAVDLSSRSLFQFNTVSPNPIFRASLVTNNVYDGNPRFGLPAELAPDPADQRTAFYYNANDRVTGFFKNDADPIPVYLPGEILLIKAEAFARKGQLQEAVAELNKVLTKTPAQDVYGLGAGLPPYDGPLTQEAILREIYRNRAIELYMTGLRLEDTRRFGRPGPNSAAAERNRNFYPYPDQERENNPNTPANPAL